MPKGKCSTFPKGILNVEKVEIISHNSSRRNFYSVAFVAICGGGLLKGLKFDEIFALIILCVAFLQKKERNWKW